MRSLANLSKLAVIKLCLATAVTARPGRLFGFDLYQAVHSAVDGHALTSSEPAQQGHHSLLEALRGHSSQHEAAGGATLAGSEPSPETAGATFVAGRVKDPEAERLPTEELHSRPPPRSPPRSGHDSAGAQAEHVREPSSPHSRTTELPAIGSPQHQRSSSSGSEPALSPIEAITRPRTSTRPKRKADRLGTWHSGGSESELSIHHSSSSLADSASPSHHLDALASTKRQRTVAVSKLYDSPHEEMFGTSTVVRKKRSGLVEKPREEEERPLERQHGQVDAEHLPREDETVLPPSRSNNAREEQRAARREGRSWTSKDGKRTLTLQQLHERVRRDTVQRHGWAQAKADADPTYRPRLSADQQRRRREKRARLGQTSTTAEKEPVNSSSGMVRRKRTPRVETLAEQESHGAEASSLSAHPQGSGESPRKRYPKISEAAKNRSENPSRQYKLSAERREQLRLSQRRYTARHPELANARNRQLKEEQAQAIKQRRSWTSKDGKLTRTAEELAQRRHAAWKRGNQRRRERIATDAAYREEIAAAHKERRRKRSGLSGGKGKQTTTEGEKASSSRSSDPSMAVVSRKRTARIVDLQETSQRPKQLRTTQVSSEAGAKEGIEASQPSSAEGASTSRPQRQFKTSERRREIVRKSHAKYAAREPERVKSASLRVKEEQAKAIREGTVWTSRDGKKKLTAEQLAERLKEYNKRGNDIKRERMVTDAGYRQQHVAYMRRWRKGRKGKETTAMTTATDEASGAVSHPSGHSTTPSSTPPTTE